MTPSLDSQFYRAFSRLQALEHEENQFDTALGPSLGATIDFFSGNGKSRQLTSQETDKASQLLLKNFHKLKTGNLAAEDLREIEAQLTRAESAWTGHLREVQYGGAQLDAAVSGLGIGGTAALALGGLVYLANPASLAALGVATGVSTFLQVGGMTANERLPPNSRLEERLQEARSHLEGFTSQTKMPIHYGDFFFRAEADTNESYRLRLPETREKFDQEMSQLAADLIPLRSNPATMLESLNSRLYLRHMHRYARDTPDVSAFFVEKEGKILGGNCQSQTMLLLSAIARLEITLSPPERIGVEVFRDHVQVVAYNSSTGELREYPSGKPHPHPRGNIYHPLILSQAFLAKHGAASPVKTEDLLIAKGKATSTEGKNKFLDLLTVQKFLFPDAEAIYNPNPLPEFAELPPPELSWTAGAPRAGEKEDPSKIPSKYAIKTYEDLEIRDPMSLEMPFHLVISERVNEGGPAAPSLLYLPSKEDAVYFESLKKDTERLEFLTLKAKKFLEEKALGDKQGIERLSNLLRDPIRMKDASPEEISKLALQFERIEKFMLIWKRLFQFRNQIQDEKLPDFELFPLNPRQPSKVVDSARGQFGKWLRDNPLPALALAEELKDGRQALYFSAVPAAFAGPHFRNAEILMEAFTDPKAVSFGRGDPSPWLQEEIDVEVWVSDQHPQGSPVAILPEPPKNPPSPKPQPSPQKATLPLSVPTIFMLHDLFKANLKDRKNNQFLNSSIFRSLMPPGTHLLSEEEYSRLFAAQWTPAFSEEFIAQPRYVANGVFVDLLPDILESRPKSTFTADNPFYNSPKMPKIAKISKVPPDLAKILRILSGNSPVADPTK